MGAQVVDGTLARGWQPEGHQLRDHLPGGRVFGEEAAVPGGTDAVERGPVQLGQGRGEELPAGPLTPSLSPPLTC